MVIFPTLLIMSFLFYMVAAMDGQVFGTPDNEIDNMINEKMNEFVNSVSNISEGNLHRGYHIGENFNNIALAMKLIPNMD